MTSVCFVQSYESIKFVSLCYLNKQNQLCLSVGVIVELPTAEDGMIVDCCSTFTGEIDDVIVVVVNVAVVEDDDDDG